MKFAHFDNGYLRQARIIGDQLFNRVSEKPIIRGGGGGGGGR